MVAREPGRRDDRVTHPGVRVGRHQDGYLPGGVYAPRLGRDANDCEVRGGRVRRRPRGDTPATRARDHLL